MISDISLTADDYIEYRHNHLDKLKKALSIYLIGGMLVLEICINSRKTSLPKLIIPIPQVWHSRLIR